MVFDHVIFRFLNDFITNENSCSTLYEQVDAMYDELVSEDKEKWKERVRLVGMLVGNRNVFYFNENDEFDESEY